MADLERLLVYTPHAHGSLWDWKQRKRQWSIELTSEAQRECDHLSLVRNLGQLPNHLPVCLPTGKRGLMSVG